jgi:hypothetical protein
MLSDAEKIAQGQERWLCLDCTKDTDTSQEYYMLKLKIWKSINPKIDGMLCLSCAEKRLGRKLVHRDFTLTPVNFGQARVCPALAERFFTDTPQKPNNKFKSLASLAGTAFRGPLT